MQLACAEGKGEGVITFYSKLRSQHTTISTQCNKLRSLELSWDKENYNARQSCVYNSKTL